ncbi:hypothetical protein FHX74_000558 [Friedmanniella endophytica]|uniref:Winged helix DNA-binding domain-containing protein n=1 Tax=Microlunatus kandeliicorticis TaxID=1759536 RepID=A0A7W3IPQ5_9ACTN|nr:crosslink repair DNA glycosylase YcaQ family protein [Microlunatus kandeliicorticis]MBA8792964.1 hypothetical protein [Microlunatus kandeliicorticis]
MGELTWAAARAWRLGRQLLAPPTDDPESTLEAVVDRLGALPAWSGDAPTALGLRLGRPAGDELRRAVQEGRVFSGYAFRGASHYLTARSAAAYLALRCAGRQWELRSWREHYGLEPEDWPPLRAAVREALADGPLGREELAAAIAAVPRYRHLRAAFLAPSQTLLKPFCWQGDLCFAPTDEGVAFRRLDGLPGWTGLLDLDAAGHWAVLHYLDAYGPAGADRIHYWLGEGLSAGRRRIDRWIEELGDRLAVLPIEGTPALCRAEDVDAIRRSAPSAAVTLLPGSDQWVLGAGTAATVVVPAAERPAATRGLPLVLVGGQVAGTWTTAGEVITVSWSDGRPPAGSDALEAAVAALGRATGRAFTLG